MAGCENLIHQEAFCLAPNLVTSDHKPIWGRFRLSVPRDFTLRQKANIQPSRVVAFLRNIRGEGIDGIDLSVAKLYVYAPKLFAASHSDRHVLQGLSSEPTLSLPTRASTLDNLRGDVESPSGQDGVTEFSESIILRVVEERLMTTDCGYTTIALRDSRTEAKLECDDVCAAALQHHLDSRCVAITKPVLP